MAKLGIVTLSIEELLAMRPGKTYELVNVAGIPADFSPRQVSLLNDELIIIGTSASFGQHNRGEPISTIGQPSIVEVV